MYQFKEVALRSKILIVDDTFANVELLESMLSMAGFTHVRSTTDSRDVSELNQLENFDLILLDIRMPHLDGFEVMEMLAVDNKDDFLPVVVVTAQNDMDTRIRALEFGALDFLTKPFDAVEVLSRIRNILDVRDLYKERKQHAQLLESKVADRTRELYRRNQELQESRLEIVSCLGRAGEYRDNETGFHVIRMSKSSELLALAAGLSEDHAKTILYASPMHDIGKIGIPDAILLNPGKLEGEDWQIMKTHVEIGVKILGQHDSLLMNLAREIALSHHEKWDGSGYPRGLAGKDIPLEGRITAICDVYDALTSSRPYKKPWTPQDAMGFINEQSGRHFDPELVSHFNRILPYIIDIRREYDD